MSRRREDSEEAKPAGQADTPRPVPERESLPPGAYFAWLVWLAGFIFLLVLLLSDLIVWLFRRW